MTVIEKIIADSIREGQNHTIDIALKIVKSGFELDIPHDEIIKGLEEIKAAINDKPNSSK